ncbi:MAG: histidine kinase dimerization/phospho-acceptor domain-containing protein [Candidatus Methylophosphatis roskildensis]
MFLLGYDSLRKRLILPFALLGLSVSAVLSSITIWLVADIDETSIKRVLLVEMESFRNRENRNPDAPAPSAPLIHGDFLPSAIYPSIEPPATEAGRFRRYKIGERKYTVLVGDIGGRPYALLYDRTLSDSGLFDLAGALVGGTLLMGGLSALLGHLLAGQVVRPIRRLLTDISEKSATIELRSGAPVSFSAAHFPDNEIGQLVRALDQFALRLHGFVQRESYFAADVSHELRTPIAVIRGAAEVLVESREFSEAAHERLRTIHRQAVRMIAGVRGDQQSAAQCCFAYAGGAYHDQVDRNPARSQRYGYRDSSGAVFRDIQEAFQGREQQRLRTRAFDRDPDRGDDSMGDFRGKPVWRGNPPGRSFSCHGRQIRDVG